MLYVVSWLVGCAVHQVPTGPTSEPIAQHEAELRSNSIIRELDGIERVTCAEGECFVQTADGTYPIDLATLEPGTRQETNPQPGTVISLQSSPKEVHVRWNEQIAGQWRSPFQDQIPTVQGGTLRYVRGLSMGGSRIIRTGGGILAKTAPDAGPVAYPRSLALHPTGGEAYLIVWPDSSITGFDPTTLRTHWRMDVGAPVTGLFITADGLHLIAETGGTAPEEQLLDYDSGHLAVNEGIDPTGDPHFSQINRPIARQTLVVSIANRSVVTLVPGRYLSLHPLDSGVSLLATTDALATVREPSPTQ